MEKVGQSESTPKIRLKCSHPYASFEWGVCDNGWNSNLQSTINPNGILFSIIINTKLCWNNGWRREKKKKEDNWDDEYGKWEVYCPEEEARQIIQGILHVVCELHSHGSSHGFLYHLENFVIQDKDLIIGDNYKKSTLLYVGAFLWSPSITKSLSWIAKFSGWYKNPWEEPRVKLTNCMEHALYNLSCVLVWWYTFHFSYSSSQLISFFFFFVLFSNHYFIVISYLL